MLSNANRSLDVLPPLFPSLSANWQSWVIELPAKCGGSSNIAPLSAINRAYLGPHTNAFSWRGKNMGIDMSDVN
jgi:hypothetical protein